MHMCIDRPDKNNNWRLKLKYGRQMVFDSESESDWNCSKSLKKEIVKEKNSSLMWLSDEKMAVICYYKNQNSLPFISSVLYKDFK